MFITSERRQLEEEAHDHNASWHDYLFTRVYTRFGRCVFPSAGQPSLETRSQQLSLIKYHPAGVETSTHLYFIMSTIPKDHMKEYIDRAVQTSTPPMLSPIPELNIGLPNSPFRITSTSKSTQTLEMSRSSPSPQILGAYSRPLSSQRILKPYLPRNRPSQTQGEMGRISSLPETDPFFSAKVELQSTSVRVVSMPEQRPSGVYFLDTSMSSDGVNSVLYNGDSFTSSTDGDLSGIYIPRIGQGIPHTPSPSPSLDSVLIIENNGELSEAFLRNNLNWTRVTVSKG